MFKKIIIALMAVAVFAIPVGASADNGLPPAPYKNETFDELVNTQKSQGFSNYFVYYSDHQYGSYNVVKILFSKSPAVVDGTDFTFSTPGYKKFTTINGTTFEQVGFSTDRVSTSISGPSTLVSLEANYVLYKSDGSVFFRVPPPPPKPVEIQAVKSVQEIVPQTATVAGGIVLAVSIILGVWLLVGLVKRLTYSFLR